MENHTPEKNESKKELSGQKRLLILTIVGFFVASILGGLYYFETQKYVYVEKCQILAPTITLSSKNGGALEKVFVEEGDYVSQNTNVAQVGNEIIITKTSGIIINAQKEIGKNFNPGETVVEMIRPEDLRLVARVEEDKGLNEIKVGQSVFFSVDAFGSKEYSGIVDEITPTAREGDVVFNISSQRQMQEFNVKIRFNRSKYPELLNGMSGKVWIYKN